jgi:arabinofuranosyltransferase
MSAASRLAFLTQRPAVRAWLAGEGLSRRVHLVIGLVLPAWVAAWNMWRVHRFTVDDSYISFRYARNLADGLGLVYNPGERIEGYTNFLWTVLLAAGCKVGIDPHIVAKVLGAASAIGTLAVVYRLGDRIAPLRTLPCVATWLLASSAPFTGYAVFGLETTFFAFLVMLGTSMMLQEVEDERARPWSGLVFAAAGLARPEAPMYLGLPMLLLGRRFFGRQNLVRAAFFAGPVLAHVFWRHSYYGAWLPATLGAKTGDLALQWKGGRSYVGGWLEHAGPLVWFALHGAALAVVRKSRAIGSVALVAGVGLLYVMLVGGDWMAYYRFVAPLEPYVFLLVGLSIRSIVETRDKAAILAIALLSAYALPMRQRELQEAHEKFRDEKRFWESSAAQVADWLVRYGTPGYVALGDIGYVGYRTNYPILDLLGLVDPVIAQLPGGYTKKIGEGFVERFYEVAPAYAVLIMTGQDCGRGGFPGVRQIAEDPRFARQYAVVHNVQVMADASWCIFKRSDWPDPRK